MNGLTNIHLMARAQLVLLACSLVGAAEADPLEQAKRIHDRIAGIPASEAVLLAMRDSIEQSGNGVAAAYQAMQNDAFYRVTLQNWVAPLTNRVRTPFVSISDYTATVLGMVRDDLDFRRVLHDDILYTAGGVEPSYSVESNQHYQTLEQGRDSEGQPYSYQLRLQRRLQSEVTGLPPEATAGVLTSRAAARAFLLPGTNRAQLRFTLINHLCRDLEQVHDITRIPDRIRQDVSRSPGGDARAFLNGCVGCHSGMDPLTQAFAHYDFIYGAATDPTGEQGRLDYNAAGDLDPVTLSRVKAKYHISSAIFPYGFATDDDRWHNYWRGGINAALGWDESLPGAGSGAESLGQELANSRAFTECQVAKVFRAVCLRAPADAADRAQLSLMTHRFELAGYRSKPVFADAADYRKGS